MWILWRVVQVSAAAVSWDAVEQDLSNLLCFNPLEEGLSDPQEPLPVPAVPRYFSNFNYSTQSLADLPDFFSPELCPSAPTCLTALEHRPLLDFSIYV